MTFQLILNLLIGVIWMFLSESYSFASFIVGFVIGSALLFLLNRFIPDSYYFKHVRAILYLIFLFIKELLLANIEVLKWIYKPKLDFQPGILALPIDVKKNWEITLLANLITLTPGTLSVDVSRDQRYIYIHALDLPDVNETIVSIKESFEKAIREVTR
ncbi:MULTISPECIES: Na+/H+ antiporter subunit E [Fictibacillus]|jgi:multicomponent Na+:H+ antiporter subunit E|uniref:Na+/H+ antiporter subunit E n=1 Tax=Fictibacillus TaxID=1329200 RepID=UPI0018CE011C|nr:MULTISPECIES: Na+/H+ antiporter subunit E [unclassified Fictibacillus]MBH0158543.1 Na+/H+ antiporter subunit E [Fictibacillus sp. 5RED26]MBH0160011.1 Na+/H+ antiporter subunit E [Fictibacillus sp. 26RED30]MBH0166302.1 Na+/H+ antiporter subunit E [Fictibacillus sp. 7GRE50]MBH0174688.1 Na+/H+ antiporter subunit E [Fictibacillus sp. 23RED33]